MSLVNAASPDALGLSAANSDRAARLRRLQWRARRGLLENDLIMTRFFETYGSQLDEMTVLGLDLLLDLPDNQLLDLMLGRTQPAPELEAGPAGRVLTLLRDL
jgi:antitoxin CptB